jgi:hypothetical protein
VHTFLLPSNKRQFSNPYCSAHFTCCKEAVIPYQHTIFVFGLCGWSALAGPVTNDLSTALKTTDPAFKLTYMATSAYTLLRHLWWISIKLEPSTVSNSITTFCLAWMSTICSAQHNHYISRYMLYKRSMKKSPSSEALTHSPIQEIPHFSCNLKAHYHQVTRN